ncbi:unnamed protein product [Cyprideis torosa]|uniref:Uncharacterized protein n=1 Tax=Cyprideis torosa TaxID=163714 RepID=A0A7R8W9Z8_9CRUS|nr:unnamed protein product [Cyprideis torosa]CAG0885383.1 unnamed protein product [Cyprideis torosa]
MEDGSVRFIVEDHCFRVQQSESEENDGLVESPVKPILSVPKFHLLFLPVWYLHQWPFPNGSLEAGSAPISKLIARLSLCSRCAASRN